ncbi:MAG: ABC transporter ATP-binding protein, partial [Proteobacteria bacterium]|nr:ABC transporter ATP-binding protein [Pseudomonadota bacterium]
LLAEYPGTVFLVSHDRRFLDNVVTSTIVYEGDARWREYEGRVEDWLTQSKRAAALQAKATPAAAPTPPPAPEPAPVVATKRKLSYKEQRELDEIPKQIAALEAEQTQLNSLIAGSELYTQGAKRIAEVTDRAAEIDAELLALMERWEVLESK